MGITDKHYVSVPMIFDNMGIKSATSCAHVLVSREMFSLALIELPHVDICSLSAELEAGICLVPPPPLPRAVERDGENSPE